MITIDHLSYQFEGKSEVILDDINLQIDVNEFVVVTGESGCGKTTLALAMCGYLFHQMKGQISGGVIVNGKDVRYVSLGELSNEIYLVQQNPENQFCTLTVQDELAFGLENQGMDPKMIEERINWALNVVCAGDIRHRDLRTLSGGEQQKVAIAAGLALRPKVIILDEPTSFLDMQATQNILEVLLDLKEKEALTVILIEHKLSQILPYKPKILKLMDGKLTVATQDYVRKISPPGKWKNTRQVLSESNSELVVDIDNMRIARNNVEVLDVKKLKIKNGDFISLLGNNGSGKTSLLYALLGLIHSESEKCEIMGKPITYMKSGSFNGEVGMVFQNPNHQFFTDSVFEELFFPINNIKKEKIIDPKWVDELIVNFRLGEVVALHPLRLSYGQKKRLSVASVLSFQPRLLMLDEIFIGQSVEEIIQLLDILDIYIKDRSAALILVNHQPEIVRNFSNRTVYLREGGIAFDQPADLEKRIFEDTFSNEQPGEVYAR